MGIHCRGTRRPALPLGRVLCTKSVLKLKTTLVCSVCLTAWAAIVVVPGRVLCTKSIMNLKTTWLYIFPYASLHGHPLLWYPARFSVRSLSWTWRRRDSSLLRMPHYMGSHCRGTRRPALPPGRVLCTKSILNLKTTWLYFVPYASLHGQPLSWYPETNAATRPDWRQPEYSDIWLQGDPATTDPAVSEFKTEPAVDKNWTKVTYKVRNEAHSEHRFPDPFLQTLPELVTPLKGHSLSPRSCSPTLSAPSGRFGYW